MLASPMCMRCAATFSKPNASMKSQHDYRRRTPKCLYIAQIFTRADKVSKKALTDAKKAVQLAPNYPPALFARATAHHFLKRHDLALRDLTSAIEIDIEAVKPPTG